MSVYYCTLLGIGPMEGQSPLVSLDRLDVRGWLALSFPLFVVPYLNDALDSFRRRRGIVFDDEVRIIRRDETRVASFADVRRLELGATNGRCEELRLSAVLSDGSKVEIHSGARAHTAAAMAAEIADLLAVELVRTQ